MAVRQRVFGVVERVPGMTRVKAAVREPIARHELRHFHDVMRHTPLDGRFWAFGGMLLAWARAGAGLPPRSPSDFDLGYHTEDHDRFLAAVSTLERAGFRRHYLFRNNAGDATEHCFRSRAARFEFFRMFPAGNHLEFFVYTLDPTDPDGLRHVQHTCAYPMGALEVFVYAGRAWLKTADHEAALAASYQDWRAEAVRYADERVVSTPWVDPQYGWH